MGNAVMYIAAHAKYPYKTEVLKLLYLMEERMVQKFHVPLLSIPFSVWRLGPVSVDVFEELSDGPVLLGDFITLQFNGQGIMVKPSREFDADEFSDAELQVMREVMERYGQMNSEELIAETHKEGSLWRETAKEHGLLEDFEQNRANSSPVIIDMARFLSPSAREHYEETLETRETANMVRLGHVHVQGDMTPDELYQVIAQDIDTMLQPMELDDTEIVDLETARAMLHKTIRDEYARL